MSAFAACVSVVVALVCAQGAVAAPVQAISEFPIPTAKSGTRAITAGSDGNLWFTELGLSANKIGQITPSGTVSEFPIPPENIAIGITAGPDGNLWFTEGIADFTAVGGNKIGRITPSGTISEFPIPTANSFPEAITAGPDGNLWFTDLSANEVGRITPSGTITEFPLPTNSGPRAITAAPDGNLWFTEQSTAEVGRIQPRLLAPAPAAECVVPKLKGKTLAQAKKLLRRAHCKLGRVTKPAKHKNKLVVVSQKPAAKKVLPSGSKVSLQLG